MNKVWHFNPTVPVAFCEYGSELCRDRVVPDWHPVFATEVDNVAVTAVTIPPVLAVFPTNGAMRVQANSAVTVQFSEAMNPATLSPSTFRLVNKNQTPISGSVTYDSTSKIATFAPQSPLAESNTFSVTLTTDIKTASGSPLPINYVWSFSTVGVPTIISANLSIGPQDTSYDGQDLLISNCKVTIDGTHSFNSLSVSNSGNITHSPATASGANNPLMLNIAQDMRIFLQLKEVRVITTASISSIRERCEKEAQNDADRLN